MAQRRGLHPAATGEPPAAAGDRAAEQAAGFVAVDETEQFGRPAKLFDGASLLRLMRRLARQVQHAAGRPAGVGQAGEQGAGGEEAGAGQAREAVVVGAGQRAQHAGQVARSAAARRGAAFEDGDLPAGGGQRVGAGAAGDAGADDEGAALGGRGVAIGPPRAEAADQHLPLAGEAWALFEVEFGGGQRVAHLAGDRPGGQRRARCRQSGERQA